MARKVALIPEELVSSYQLQKPEIRLEDDIVNLLDQKQLSDDMKVKLLGQLITRYQKVTHEPAPPVKVSLDEGKKKNESGDTENYEHLEEEGGVDEENLILKDITLSVPHAYAKFVPLIAEKLKTRGYAWNQYGEFTENNVPIKNSRVVDFFQYIFRNLKARPEPQHFKSFFKAIKEINIPRSWIANKNILRILKFDEGSFIASTPVKATRRERSRSAADSHDGNRRRRAERRSASPSFDRTIAPGSRSMTESKWLTY